MKLNDLSSITDRVRLPATEHGGTGISCVETATFQGRKVIIKTLKSDAPYDIKQFRAEIDALKSIISHKNSEFVVKVMGYCEAPLALIWEWCDGKSLDSFAGKLPDLPWRRRSYLLADISTGLLAYHKRDWETSEPGTYVCMCVRSSQNRALTKKLIASH